MNYIQKLIFKAIIHNTCFLVYNVMNYTCKENMSSAAFSVLIISHVQPCEVISSYINTFHEFLTLFKGMKNKEKGNEG